jgi:outer membrane translocation and assembly module TamA
VARSTVHSVLRSFGYPNPRIADSTLSSDGESLTVRIEPGPRRHIALVEITGIDEERAQQLRELLSIAPGNPVRTDRLVVDAINLEDDLHREGFSEARVRSVTRPADSAAAPPADRVPTIVELRVERGPRYRLADVELEGARKTRRKWALGITGLEPGQTLTRPEIAEVRRRFYQTGLFSSVYVDTRLHENGDTTLVIGVDERPPLTLGYGLRWESEDGPGVVLDVLQRNALGRGIALGARVLYTEDRQFARIYSDVPYIFGTRNTLETFVELRDEIDEDGFPREEYHTSVQLARNFGPYTTGRAYVRHLRQVTVFEDPFLGRFEDVLQTPALGTQLIFDRRADPLSGQKGLFASADLSGSGDFLESDRDYLRFFGQINLYRPAGRPFGRQLGWTQSFRLGAAESFDDQPLADDDAFRAGGEFSIRGYPMESIGPRDPNTGRLLGGNAVLVLNQELHFPIAGRFNGLLFFDSGNVWESIEDFELELLSAVGAGLRVDSPIGLLRLDLAYPLDRRDDDGSFKVYVGFGQVF